MSWEAESRTKGSSDICVTIQFFFYALVIICFISNGKMRAYTTMCMSSHFSHIQLFMTIWTVARHAPLFMGFSRQENWSGLPCPPLECPPHQGLNVMFRSYDSCIGRQVLYHQRYSIALGLINPFPTGHCILSCTGRPIHIHSLQILQSVPSVLEAKSGPR